MSLRNFVKWVIKNLSVHRIIDELQQSEHIATCCKRTSRTGEITFNKNTIIWNLQNDPDSIEIGDKSQIEAELQVFRYGGRIEIGKNCYVGRNTKVWSGELIKIGNDVLISHNVNIIDTNAHEIDAEERVSRHHQFLESGHWKTKGSIKTAPIVINDKAWINFNVTILKGVTIGEGAIIGAGTLITKDVEPWTVVGGNPAQVIKRLK